MLFDEGSRQFNTVIKFNLINDAVIYIFGKKPIQDKDTCTSK